MTIHHLPLAAPLLGSIAWMAVVLLGQGTGALATADGTGTGFVGDLVQTGFLAWFAWHVTTKTIPEQANRSRQTAAEQADKFLAALRERDNTTEAHLTLFIGELRADRKSNESLADSNRQLAVAVAELTGRVKSRPQD